MNENVFQVHKLEVIFGAVLSTYWADILNICTQFILFCVKVKSLSYTDIQQNAMQSTESYKP